MLWSVCSEVMWRSTAYGFVLRKLVAGLSICFHRYVMIPHNVWRNHRSGTAHICTCENSYLGPCALVSEITNALVFSAVCSNSFLKLERLCVGIVLVTAVFL